MAAAAGAGAGAGVGVGAVPSQSKYKRRRKEELYSFAVAAAATAAVQRVTSDLYGRQMRCDQLPVLPCDEKYRHDPVKPKTAAMMIPPSPMLPALTPLPALHIKHFRLEIVITPWETAQDSVKTLILPWVDVLPVYLRWVDVISGTPWSSQDIHERVSSVPVTFRLRDKVHHLVPHQPSEPYKLPFAYEDLYMPLDLIVDHPLGTGQGKRQILAFPVPTHITVIPPKQPLRLQFAKPPLDAHRASRSITIKFMDVQQREIPQAYCSKFPVPTLEPVDPHCFVNGLVVSTCHWSNDLVFPLIVTNEKKKDDDAPTFWIERLTSYFAKATQASFPARFRVVMDIGGPRASADHTAKPRLVSTNDVIIHIDPQLDTMSRFQYVHPTTHARLAQLGIVEHQLHPLHPHNGAVAAVTAPAVIATPVTAATASDVIIRGELLPTLRFIRTDRFGQMPFAARKETVTIRLVDAKNTNRIVETWHTTIAFDSVEQMIPGLCWNPSDVELSRPDRRFTEMGGPYVMHFAFGKYYPPILSSPFYIRAHLFSQVRILEYEIAAKIVDQKSPVKGLIQRTPIESDMAVVMVDVDCFGGRTLDQNILSCLCLAVEYQQFAANAEGRARYDSTVDFHRYHSPVFAGPGSVMFAPRQGQRFDHAGNWSMRVYFGTQDSMMRPVNQWIPFKRVIPVAEQARLVDLKRPSTTLTTPGHIPVIDSAHVALYQANGLTISRDLVQEDMWWIYRVVDVKTEQIVTNFFPCVPSSGRDEKLPRDVVALILSNTTMKWPEVAQTYRLDLFVTSDQLLQNRALCVTIDKPITFLFGG